MGLLYVDTIMAKEPTIGAVFRDDEVEWASVRAGKGGVESLDSGRVSRLAPPGEDGDVLSDAESPVGELKTVFGGGKPVIGIPLKDLLLRVLDFPCVDESDLAGMVELQVDKISPFPIDQMVISHEVIGTSSEGLVVLVAAVPRGIVDAIGLVVSDVGSAPGRVDAEIMGWWRELLQGDLLAEDGTEALIRFREQTIEMAVHEAGTPRSFTYVGEAVDLSSAELMDELADEITHALMTFEMDAGVPSPSMVTIWAEGDPPSEFVAALQSRIDAEIRVRSLSLLSSPAASVATRDLAGGARLDLTPQDWTDAVIARGFRHRLWGIAAGVLLLWTLIVGAGFGGLLYQRSVLGGLQSQDEQLIPGANEVRLMRRKVGTIQRYMNHTNSALETLREVVRQMPGSGVDLSEFTYRKDDAVVVVGEADTSQLVLSFNERLNASDVFTNVVSGARSVTKRGRNRFRFDLAMPGGDE